MSQDYHGASPLAHFNTVELIDALTTGVVVLDAQFCVVYANVGARGLLGSGLNQARGRPFSALLANPSELQTLLRRSLDHGETCTAAELTLTPVSTASGEHAAVIVDATVTPLEGTITGRHLLLELADARARSQMTRENELLTPVDGRRFTLHHEVSLLNDLLLALGTRERTADSAGAAMDGAQLKLRVTKERHTRLRARATR